MRVQVYDSETAILDNNNSDGLVSAACGPGLWPSVCISRIFCGVSILLPQQTEAQRG